MNTEITTYSVKARDIKAIQYWGEENIKACQDFCKYCFDSNPSGSIISGLLPSRLQFIECQDEPYFTNLSELYISDYHAFEIQISDYIVKDVNKYFIVLNSHAFITMFKK